MSHDATTSDVNQIGCTRLPEGFRRLTTPLTGTDDWHGDVIGTKDWSKATLDAANHRVIRFPELVLQTIHVQMIGTSQPPQFLPRGIGHAQQRMTAIHAPTVAMSVNRKLTMFAELGQCGETDAMQTHHDARSARRNDRIV